MLLQTDQSKVNNAIIEQCCSKVDIFLGVCILMAKMIAWQLSQSEDKMSTLLQTHDIVLKVMWFKEIMIVAGKKRTFSTSGTIFVPHRKIRRLKSIVVL